MTETWTVEQFLAYTHKSGKKRNKFNASPMDLGGHHFQSIREAQRYLVLMAWMRDGQISNLRVHEPQILILPKFATVHGDKFQDIIYTPDFTYLHGSLWVVEDIKSKATRRKRDFVITWKLLNYYLRDNPNIRCQIVE